MLGVLFIGIVASSLSKPKDDQAKQADSVMQQESPTFDGAAILSENNQKNQKKKRKRKN